MVSNKLIIQILVSKMFIIYTINIVSVTDVIIYTIDLVSVQVVYYLYY